MENKNSPIMICRVHRTCTWNRMFAWLNKGCCLFAIAEKGMAQFCNRLRLWPVLLHCVTKIYLFFPPFVCIAHQCLSTGLERLIYDVNRAVKGKANRKEHAQHQRRKLSCSYIFLFFTPSICPVTTEGPAEVRNDAGLSLSIMANVLKGSITSDRAVSYTHRHQYLIICFGLGAFLTTGKCPFQWNMWNKRKYIISKI